MKLLAATLAGFALGWLLRGLMTRPRQVVRTVPVLIREGEEYPTPEGWARMAESLRGDPPYDGTEARG
jgi:hypothetical protein